MLVPYLTHIEPACERGLRELERRGLEVRRYSATAAIDRTRSEVATAAIGEGYDELMWIDSDIAFEADEFSPQNAHAWAIAREIRRFLNRPDPTNQRALPTPSPAGDPIGGPG